MKNIKIIIFISIILLSIIHQSFTKQTLKGIMFGYSDFDTVYLKVEYSEAMYKAVKQSIVGAKETDKKIFESLVLENIDLHYVQEADWCLEKGTKVVINDSGASYSGIINDYVITSYNVISEEYNPGGGSYDLFYKVTQLSENIREKYVLGGINLTPYKKSPNLNIPPLTNKEIKGLKDCLIRLGKNDDRAYDLSMADIAFKFKAFGNYYYILALRADEELKGEPFEHVLFVNPNFHALRDDNDYYYPFRFDNITPVDYDNDGTMELLIESSGYESWSISIYFFTNPKLDYEAKCVSYGL